MKPTTDTGTVDLTQFLPTENSTLEMIAGDKKTGWNLTLCPRSHPKARAYAELSTRQSAEKSRLVEAAQINGRAFVPEEKAVDAIRRESVQWAVARILDWTPISIAGEALTFSDETATDIFTRPEMNGFYTQLVQALNDESRFMPRSA